MIVDIHNEDCVTGMQRLPSASVDVVVTSPPYNIGIPYSHHEDNLTPEKYLVWCLAWGEQITRVLKLNGSFFLNVGGSSANPTLPLDILSLFTRKLPLILQNTFVWIKSITVEEKGKEVSVGHFKPVNSPRFVNSCHEYVYQFTLTGKVPISRLSIGVHYKDKSNVKRWNSPDGEDLRCRGSCWFIPYDTIQSRKKQRPHPATFPVRLAENCLRLHAGSDGSTMTVLDPFCGIGTTGVAAAKTGCFSFIGYDIDPFYADTARSRIECST
jgi:site-specific DNA-methyltransferase (adenine-specific)